MNQNKFDIVIIGSGLGGLACGSILSRNGYKVCVLEKHHQIGGCLQDFVRCGCRFNTGMHYIGSYGDGQILRRLFDYFGLKNKLDVEKMDNQAFDIINIAGVEYRYAMGLDNFRRQLNEYFPTETDAIEKYCEKMISVSQQLDLLNLRHIEANNFDFDTSSLNAYDFICSITNNERLRQVFSGLNSLYAGSMQNTSFHTHFVINKFFIDSAWRLSKGGEQIANGLRDAIVANGGEVRTHAEVVHLQNNDKSIIAAELRNGDRVEADYFISDIHPSLTISLTDAGVFKKAFATRVEIVSDTISCFCVYAVLKKKSFAHRNSNYYYNKTESVWGVDNYDKVTWPAGFMLYTSEDSQNRGYAESATIITPMKFDEVALWNDTTVGHRGADYEQFKSERASQLLNVVSEVFPDFVSSVDKIFSSSPLTFRDYTGTRRGAMYGIERNCNNVAESLILPRTRIPNLLFVGQNTNIHGVLGVSMGAVLTAGELIGINNLIDKIRNDA